ncbi:long-subunit fatty acid transport protein [Rhodococcus erythropolis]|nr:hypothetical protein N601_01525 [Rhodococcus erythropolis DN1]MCW2297629.1 long-subunit fatty acid transport protein [Rhodococcus erythropolis]
MEFRSFQKGKSSLLPAEAEQTDAVFGTVKSKIDVDRSAWLPNTYGEARHGEVFVFGKPQRVSSPATSTFDVRPAARLFSNLPERVSIASEI